jgi:IPT/TIG domain
MPILAGVLGPGAPAVHAAIVSLDVHTVIITPLEGVPFNGTVATFPDPGVGPYTARIEWGDGESSPGSIGGGCQGNVCSVFVTGVHTYRQVGQYVLKVHASNFNGLADGQESKTIAVKDAPLQLPEGRTIGMTPGRLVNGVIASFADANLFATPADYSISIDWGDGTSSGGTADPIAVCCNSGSHFNILGSHTYSAPGTYSVVSTVTDILGGQQPSATVKPRSVIYAPFVTVVANNQATEGRFFEGILARVPDDKPGVTYDVKIDWGDGTVDAPKSAAGGCIANANGGQDCFWSAGGVHTYREEGDKQAIVTFTGSDGSGGTGTTVISVGDAPLTNLQGNVLPIIPGTAFSGIVSSFRDANPFGDAGDFTATVEWGDGTVSSATVQPVQGCCSGAFFNVVGSHVYGAPGAFAVRTTITDVGGTQAAMVGTAGGLAVNVAPVNLEAGTSPVYGFSVATFRAQIPCNDFSSASYSATISWGDGTTSNPGISNAGGCAGTFFIGDRHTYANGGVYPLVITVRGSDGSGGSGLGTAIVTPLTSPVTNPVPVLGSLSPNQAQQASGAFTLTISGTDFTSGSVVRWNGSDRPTVVFSPSQLGVVIPASDLQTATDLATASVTVFNPGPGGGSSNPLAFTISSPKVSIARSAVAPGGSSAGASTAPSVAGEAGVAVTFNNNASTPTTVTAATYVTNPTPRNVFLAGGGFVDVRLSGTPLSGSVSARFYYPSTVTGAAEAGLQLLYFDGTAWVGVRGSGASAPQKDTTDNLDGTLSGGRFTVTFDSTSTPTLDGLGGTVFAMSTLPAPAVSSLSPTLGPDLGGTAVTVLGAHFQPGAHLTFDGVDASGVQVQSDTAIAVIAPAHAAGVVDVVITNPDGQRAMLPASFTYFASGGGNPGGGPDPSATPELDSLLLFGSGLSGLGAYAVLRLRTRRRRHVRGTNP